MFKLGMFCLLVLVSASSFAAVGEELVWEYQGRWENSPAVVEEQQVQHALWKRPDWLGPWERLDKLLCAAGVLGLGGVALFIAATVLDNDDKVPCCTDQGGNCTVNNITVTKTFQERCFSCVTNETMVCEEGEPKEERTASKQREHEKYYVLQMVGIGIMFFGGTTYCSFCRTIDWTKLS